MSPLRNVLHASRQSISCLRSFCGWLALGSLLVSVADSSQAQETGNEIWMSYFEQRVSAIEEAANELDPQTPEARRQLQEMLGLDPFPERTPLQPQVTGAIERDGVIVENIHFQSRPGLYVTANLYRPAEAEAPCPAVLYLCGHGAVKENGISFGNKVYYQHHGYWMARHGFVCLMIDSLQLGEIEAIHHGTYQYDRWWWLSRGYTPAGVEAWNCIRALDYLETRDEVDSTRMGCTGRSGGGAYSWWIAALDERITCAAPVAGITDLRDHVIHGCVEGHCDCMFMVNTYRWDYSQVAALVAPRPLLIVNTDRDPIFPLEGVVRIHRHVASLYERNQAVGSLGLVIGPGPHEDTQDLQVPTLRWFRSHFMNNAEPIAEVAEAKFSKEELRVFQQLPSDEINSKIDESFVPVAEAIKLGSADSVETHIADVKRRIGESVMRPWLAREEQTSLLETQAADNGLPFESWRVETDEPLAIELLVGPMPAQPAGIRMVLISSPDELTSWQDSTPADQWLIGCLPRGTGELVWQGTPTSLNHFHRRLYLIGETLAAGQAWDTLQAIAMTHSHWNKLFPGSPAPTIELAGKGSLAWVSVLAASQDERVKRLTLVDLSTDRQERPALFNIDRWVTPLDLLGVTGEQCELRVSGLTDDDRSTLEQWSATRHWPEQQLQWIDNR